MVHNKIKILHLEDRQTDAELIAWQLKKSKISPEIVVVPDKSRFINALKNFSYDIILSDHSLAAFDSSEALKLVRKAGIDVPFILVTAAMNDEFAAQIIKEGAWDYILKDRLHRLPSAIINSIEKHDLEQRREAELTRANEETKQLSVRLQLATKSAGMGIWEWDIKKNHLSWDEGMYRLYNIDSVQFGSVYEGWISRLHPDDKERVNEEIQMAVAGKRKYDTEFRVIWGDGSIHTIKATGIVEKDAKGHPVTMIGANRDISEQKLAEEKLNKANRLYSFISQVNQSIAHVKNEDALFKNACRIAVKFGKFKIAWLGLFGNENTTITRIEQTGIAVADMANFKDVKIAPNGPQSYVLHTGKHYICNNIMDSPELEQWKPLAIKHALNSCMILPFKKMGTIIGTFNLYATDTNFFNDEEIKLLLEVTSDISFALDMFEKEKKHKKTQELVVQNEKRFRTMIEKSADMITLSAASGELVYCSNTITNGLGYTLAEFLGKSVFEIIHPDDLEDFIIKRAEIARAPGKSFYYQQRRKHKNGNWIWCEGSQTNMLHEPGINAMVSNFRDISEKKAAEKQLDDSLAFTRGVLNSLSSHIAVIDNQGNIIAVNGQWKRFASENGATDLRRVFEGSNYFNVCEQSAKAGDETAAEMLKGMKEVLAGKSPFFYLEYDCHSPDKERWFGMRTTKFESNGSMIVVSHADITERKLAERKLLNSESRLKEAQAIARIGNFESDLANNSDVWSDEMFTIFGVAKEEVTPSVNLVLSFVHPDDHDRVKTRVNEKLSALNGNVLDFRFIPRHGSLRYGRAEVRFEFDADQNPVRLFGILQDVTENKLAEIELARILDELIERNNDLEQFAYIISHNLRAPVANIIGASNALSDPDLSTEDQETLRRGINTSVIRLDDVIKDLNHILQIKSEISPAWEKIHFSALVEQIKVSIKNLIEEYSIELKCDFSEVDEFSTLRPYLYSIFYNLISNSIKYRRPQAHTLIEIKSRRVENRVELIFADNGMGINLEKSSNQVFGLYKRFHHHIDGKGIGLFMVKTQVEKLGGKITVRSKEGEGTLFTIGFEV